MNNTIGSLAHRKKLLTGLGLVVLVAAWWAFRPEKLFINQRVNEPAPFLANSGPQPVFTGPLEDGAHDTIGRATIYTTSGGRRYLRVSGLNASAKQLHVGLRGTGPMIDLGALQSPGEQDFDLAPSVDLNRYDSVAISRDHADAFAVARLQPF